MSAEYDVIDPWRERACAVCGKLFRPKTHGRRDAARAKVCGTSCGGKLGAAVGGKLRGRTKNSFGRKLRPEEEIPCSICSLRGHVAGDPDRCIQASPLMQPRGLGGQWW